MNTNLTRLKILLDKAKHTYISPSVHVKETITKHSDEISVIQNEIILFKAIIVKMESKINDLNQEIELGKKTKIEDIVKIVVSMLNTSKSSETSSEVEYKNNSEAQCDQCSYKYENEELLISHMSKKHEDSYSCNLCGECSGTNNSLKSHNKYFHNIKSYSSESECDSIAEKDNKKQQNHEKKINKKKTKSRK